MNYILLSEHDYISVFGKNFCTGINYYVHRNNLKPHIKYKSNEWLVFVIFNNGLDYSNILILFLAGIKFGLINGSIKKSLIKEIKKII